jgi:hypothetical protein
MKKPILDITPVYDKYGRLPETDRRASWAFSVEGEALSFSGTLEEASSAASLYARANALENATFLLMDYRPAPRVFRVTSFDN